MSHYDGYGIVHVDEKQKPDSGESQVDETPVGFQLPLSDVSKAIVFLHIGKAGGTSFDGLMKKLKSR